MWGEGHPPKYPSGGQEWSRIKSRVKASVQELARELLSLYAARKLLRVMLFRPINPGRRSLRNGFLEETPDQLRSIEEVKADMEKDRPMDRLLCGDVGYGKTEVALRAAFKAVIDGKQVAFLVPTTILRSSYENFLERFKGFPMKVELLSRFRSAKEQKGLSGNQGRGCRYCHRDAQAPFKDIGFKDLGLLIIDEEHRFGVRHKEKLKCCAGSRCAEHDRHSYSPHAYGHFGSQGFERDRYASGNRYPVQTYVVEYSHNLIRKPYSGNSTVAGRFIISIIVSRQLKNGLPNCRSLFPGPGLWWHMARCRNKTGRRSCTSFC